MKHFYFLFFLFSYVITYAQTHCDEANGYLVNAYSHVKDSYEANNISHLKYYANRSLESFKLSKKNLVECGCTTALSLVKKGIDHLAMVETAETYEDGRFFVKRAREIAKESIVELDKFTASSNKNKELTALEFEQKQLEEQQLALEKKEEALKLKLAAQKLKSEVFEKEKTIKHYKSIIASNIKTFNSTLQVCDCKHSLLSYDDKETGLQQKNISEIKDHYLNDLEKLTKSYLSTLASCDKN
ncbi:hypothetical protein ABI125_07125 [Tamlana crocina]